MHEMVAAHVFGGLAGAIVVEDALDLLPELAAATERVLVVSDPAIGSSSSALDASMVEKMRGREGDVVVVKGVLAPTIAAQAGTVECWRMINASPSRCYRLGRVEDWTIINSSPMDHPFHLHLWPFQSVARTDGLPIAPGWKDTVNVPAGQSVTVRVPLTDIAGRTVYHCHILDHEDLAMMGVVKVS